jgi:hypothetical protein
MDKVQNTIGSQERNNFNKNVNILYANVNTPQRHRRGVEV